MFQYVIKAFTIFPILSDYNEIIITFTYVIGSICAFILIFFLLYFAFDIHKSLKPMIYGFLFWFFQLTTTIFYIPILGIAMSLIRCKSDGVNWVSFTDPNTNCFTSSHQTNGCIGIAVSVLFFILTLIYKSFIFPLGVSIKNPIGRLDILAFPLFHALRTSFMCLVIALPTVCY